MASADTERSLREPARFARIPAAGGLAGLWLCAAIAGCAHPAPAPLLEPGTTERPPIEARREFVRDAQGNLQRVDEDRDDDGRIDVRTWIASGAPYRRQIDLDLDGRPDLWSWYGPGGLERVEIDRDRDGFRDRILYYRGGQLVGEAFDDDGDGHCERRLEAPASGESP